LKDIVEGPAFRGSHRSAQFLTYVVEQSIAGRFDLLKERLIGVELFGRNPSYDTGEDAIVRVTASDVRRRLLQHYGRTGPVCELRLKLPSGSYIPEITHERNFEKHSNGVLEVPHQPDSGAQTSISNHSSPLTVANEEESAVDPHIVPHEETSPHRTQRFREWLFVGCFLAAIALTIWSRPWKKVVPEAAAPIRILPWSVFFNSSHPIHLITSDPNIVKIQEITGNELSVSDYANHRYIPEPNNLTPEEIHLCHTVLWGDDSAAAVDVPITAGIAALAEESSKKIDVRAARGIQLADLKTDDNFIFLGSPRSNPWSALFMNELDFRFVFQNSGRQEILENVHPRPGELPQYVPTALGWATGHSYAIVAFIQNLDQNGDVLLLAGANGEGTEAAGRLVSDPSRLSDALLSCGIKQGGPLKHFEMLLRLNTMAGSPTDAKVVTCHTL
jgi:hypothetical protein